MWDEHWLARLRGVSPMSEYFVEMLATLRRPRSTARINTDADFTLTDWRTRMQGTREDLGPQIRTGPFVYALGMPLNHNFRLRNSEGFSVQSSIQKQEFDGT